MSPMPVTQTNRTLNTLRALREIPPGTDERLDIARRHRRNVWPQCMSWTPTEVAMDQQMAADYERWEKRQGLPPAGAWSERQTD